MTPSLCCLCINCLQARQNETYHYILKMKRYGHPNAQIVESRWMEYYGDPADDEIQSSEKTYRAFKFWVKDLKRIYENLKVETNV